MLISESDDDLPVRPAFAKDLSPKEGVKKNKGKGKEVRKPDNKGRARATHKGADQGGNPKM